jgi:hypothetical protein
MICLIGCEGENAKIFLGDAMRKKDLVLKIGGRRMLQVG